MNSAPAYGTGGTPVHERGCDVIDINDDGLNDLVCYFDLESTGLLVGDAEAILKGQLTDGTTIDARDSVRIEGIGFNDRTLSVNGTQGSDWVVIRQIRGEVAVFTNFDSPRAVKSDQVATIHVNTFEGSDTASLGRLRRIISSVVVSGGDGNDMLIGSSNDDILIGGDGRDTVLGRGGDDLIVGGSGLDLLGGGGGQDLLISGFTLFDRNLQALSAIQAEWTNPMHGYETRIDLLSGNESNSEFLSRRNESYFLVRGDKATVFDDGATDRVFGGHGRDWFFADKREDRLFDYSRRREHLH